MAWIKFEKDLLTDPRVLRIARTLQARWALFDRQDQAHSDTFDPCNAVALPAVTLVCGALVRIWSLADTHLGSDDILPLGIEELNDHIGIPGFCELMPADWIQEIDEHAVKLPEFHEHNGTEAKKKAVTQKRVERYRNRNAQALHGGNGQALPDQTRPDQNKTPIARDKKIELSPEGNWTGLTDIQVAMWRKAYPAVAVESELVAAAAWILANPKNKKSNYARFLNNWLNRQQDRAPRVPGAGEKRVAL